MTTGTWSHACGRRFQQAGAHGRSRSNSGKGAFDERVVRGFGLSGADRGRGGRSRHEGRDRDFGLTGFAPLTLASEAGIFKKNGLDVTIKKIPQASRHLAIQSGDIQCAATTVETWVVERERRRHEADLPARQELRRRRSWW